MTPLQAVVTVLCAIIAVAGVITSSILGYKQFKLKRKDELEANSVDKKIADAIESVKKEFLEKLTTGLFQRGEEGRERFEINSKQIEKNTQQISEILAIVKDQTVKYDKMAELLTASAESQRNSNFDRLLIVTNKVLKSGKMTISDKTNLKQLYSSWQELGGADPKLELSYEECMKLTPIPDEG